MKQLLCIAIILTWTSVEAQALKFRSMSIGEGGSARFAGWVDVDGDGQDEVIISQGPKQGSNNQVYRWTGKRFEEIKAGIVSEDGSPSDGMSWADADLDGDLDAYLCTWYGKPNHLYLQNGDHFTLGEIRGDDNTFSEGCVWGDVNRDGLPELVVSNSAGKQPNLLYNNQGKGKFTAAKEGLAKGSSRGVLFTDLNGDGWQDLVICNENLQANQLLINKKGTLSTDHTYKTFCKQQESSLSVASGDLNNDGAIDLLVLNHRAPARLFIQEKGKGFLPFHGGGLGGDTLFAFAGCLGDADNDGDLDLFVSQGWGDTTYVAQLYLNDGKANFERWEGKTFKKDKGWGFGCAWGDLDRDGQLDLLQAKWYEDREKSKVYRNRGNNNQWIGLSLKQEIDKPLLGTRITARTSQQLQTREYQSSTGYCSQNSSLIHFGLGQAQEVEIEIQWPDGSRRIFRDLRPGAYYQITSEGEAQILE